MDLDIMQIMYLGCHIVTIMLLSQIFGVTAALIGLFTTSTHGFFLGGSAYMNGDN